MRLRANRSETVLEQISRVEPGKLLLVFDHEVGVGRHLEVRPDLGNQPPHPGAMAFVQRHELDRLRQSEHGRDGDEDRSDAPDQEQELPAILRHQGCGHNAGDRAADRHEADRDQRQGRAQLPRRGFGVDGNDVGNNAADADAGDQAQPEHLRDVAGVGCNPGEYTKQQQRADERGLAAVAVTDPAKKGRAK
jgi:hypothetical protein